MHLERENDATAWFQHALSCATTKGKKLALFFPDHSFDDITYSAANGQLQWPLPSISCRNWLEKRTISTLKLNSVSLTTQTFREKLHKRANLLSALTADGISPLRAQQGKNHDYQFIDIIAANAKLYWADHLTSFLSPLCMLISFSFHQNETIVPTYFDKVHIIRTGKTLMLFLFCC